MRDGSPFSLVDGCWLCIALKTMQGLDPYDLIRVCRCAGKLGISCAETKLSLQLAFEAKHSVSGQVARSLRRRQQAIAHMTGTWTGQVRVATHNAKTQGSVLEGM